jgi:hypothetical protein
MNARLLQLTGLSFAGTIAACPGPSGRADGHVILPKTDCHWETDPQNPSGRTLVCSSPESHTGGDTTGISGGH